MVEVVIGALQGGRGHHGPTGIKQDMSSSMHTEGVGQWLQGAWQMGSHGGAWEAEVVHFGAKCGEDCRNWRTRE